MFKKQHLALAIAATLAAGAAQAALETSVVLKNETARFLKDGIRTGEATSSTDTTGAGKETFKFENTAKIFLNDELDNGMSWHGELNIVRDTKAIEGYKGHETNTQKDWLRELYIDTTAGDWDLRLGKQQVVWGTADGIKLLDNVNPTDWSEFNQNAPADARIPVWMISAEKYLDNGDNLQVVASQAKAHKIAGISTDATRAYNGTPTGIDAGHPFIMKGVDTITGKVNGFLNIGGAMGGVTNTFYNGGFTNPNGGASPFYNESSFIASAYNGYAGGNAAYTATTFFNPAAADNLIAPPEITTVANFADGFTATAVGILNLDVAGCGTGADGADCLSSFTEMTNSSITNLYDNTGGDYDYANPNSTWEYMPNATFATFNAFVQMGTKYEVKHPDDLDSNLNFRYRKSLDNGLNMSFAYQYAYDPNPVVQIHWENSSGATLTPEKTVGYGGATTLHLKDSSGTYYGAVADYSGTYVASGAAGTSGEDPSDWSVATASYVNLVFEETLERVQNFGTSMDYAVDLGDTPVVLRGEFLYQKDVKTPVVNRTELGIGNLTEALKMEEADYFKYVLGADVTVLTDMMLSGQFIQFRNLDYIDEGTSLSSTTWRYTADQAAMHLSNGLQKAEENKNFYSVFLSKPFGDSGEGRWNNIFIYEEGGGKWNRFDVEYGFDDQLIGTFEVNKYFGDENTMFGQFENASNIQVGIKYLLQ